METLVALRIVLGSAFVLFVPGFAWTYVFFKRGKIDGIERVALSFALSIVLVPLTIFYLNRILGVDITLVNSVIIILVITAVPVAIRRIGTEKVASALKKRLSISKHQKR